MMDPKRIHDAPVPGLATEKPMTYPPQNPYDPSQPPGYGQPSPAPQHYTTDADPYSRPDPYGPGQGYGNPPMSVQPGSVPPGQPYSPGPAYSPGQSGGYQPTQPPPPGPPGGAFQPGQAAPPPPGSSTNMPLIITLVVVVVLVIGGGILLGVNLSGKETTEAATTTEAAEETSEAEQSAEEETTEAAEETTEAVTEGESVYRVPVEGECIENVTTGFYVVDCASADAYWSVLKIVQSPEDPDPSDPYHAVAATDACEGSGNTQYYYTDTAIAAGRDWDPDIDSITAVYCVKEV